MADELIVVAIGLALFFFSVLTVAGNVSEGDLKLLSTAVLMLCVVHFTIDSSHRDDPARGSVTLLAVCLAIIRLLGWIATAQGISFFGTSIRSSTLMLALVVVEISLWYLWYRVYTVRGREAYSPDDEDSA